MSILLITLLVILSTATLMPLIRHRIWWVRAFDFPRLQIAVLLFLWVVLAVLSHTLKSPGVPLVLIVLGIAMLGAQLWWIWPTSPWHRREVPTASATDKAQAPRLSLIVSNVLMPNRNSDALLSHVREQSPDLLITLESDHWWQQQLDTLDSHPHRVAVPLDNLYGMHLYSRLPLLQTSVDYLVEADIPSISACVQLQDDSTVMLHIVHPRPPAPGESDESTQRDVELLVLAKAIEHSDQRIIVTGDLNDVAWSKTTRLFRHISGLLDPRIGRGMINTFHAGYWFMRWPLDHVFVSPHFRVARLQRLRSIDSDHFPVLAEFTLTDTAVAPAQRDAPAADDELLEDTLDTPEAKQAGEPGIRH